MLKEERSVITEIKEIFEKGYSDKFEKPSAELFEEIVKEHGHFKYDDSEIKIRIQIIEVLERELEKGESSHIKKEEINNLLGLAKDSTVTIWAFIYNCIYTAAMCGGNTCNRKSTGSQSKEHENCVINDVAGFSEAEKAKSLYDIHKGGKG